MRYKKIILFLKVFCILLILGVVLPYIVKLLITKFHFINNQIPSGNSVFVMHRGMEENGLKDVIWSFFREFIQFL